MAHGPYIFSKSRATLQTRPPSNAPFWRHHLKMQRATPTPKTTRPLHRHQALVGLNTLPVAQEGSRLPRNSAFRTAALHFPLDRRMRGRLQAFARSAAESDGDIVSNIVSSSATAEKEIVPRGFTRSPKASDCARPGRLSRPLLAPRPRSIAIWAHTKPDDRRKENVEEV
jgi:hypothetical protein